MVEYTEWTAILFDEYPGAEATEVISVAATHWNRNKAGLKAASKTEARQYAQQNV